MNQLQLQQLGLISKQIHNIHRLLEIYLVQFDHFIVRLFEDVLIKYVIFYEVSILGNPVREDDIEILTDTAHLIRRSSTQFLYDIANCIKHQLDYEADLLFCIQKTSLLNNFIHLFDLCSNSVLTILNRTYTINQEETTLVSELKNEIVELKRLLPFFIGEWYDNENPTHFEHSIPFEYGESN